MDIKDKVLVYFEISKINVRRS